MKAEEFFRELLRIPSPSLKEERMAGYLISRFAEYGYSFIEDSFGNLLFYRSMEGMKIMFEAHMDTVDPAIEPHAMEDETSFFTDGTTALGADDKAGIAAMLEYASESSSDKAIFLLCRAEEIGLMGSSKLEARFFDPFDIAYCISLDTQGDVGRIISTQTGKNRITVTVKGRKAHAGFSPEKGINAIKCASEMISRLESGRIDEETTMNVGSFIAEGSTNVVPSLARFQYEIRSISSSKRKALTDKLVETCMRTAEEFHAEAEASVEELYLPYSIPDSDPMIDDIKCAMEAIGVRPELFSSTGGSDANNLNRIGIKSLVIGIGYRNAHGNEERIEKKQLSLLALLIREIA